MALLLHPSHRKFIKLLRSHADQGVVITDQDIQQFQDLLRRTNNAKKRHLAIYRLFFKIINRHTIEEGYPLTQKIVDIIERELAKCELRSLRMTFLGAVVMPFLQSLYRVLNK